MRHADRFKDLLDARLVVGRQRIKQRAEHAARPVERQFEIVPHGVAFEHGRLLEFAADAELGDIGLVLLGEVDRVLEDHPAGVGTRLARDDVHHRRLAGTVRANDRAKLSRFDHERQRIDRLEPVEGDGDVFQIEQAFRACFGNRVHRLTPLPEPVGRPGPPRHPCPFPPRPLPSAPCGQQSRAGLCRRCRAAGTA